MVDPRGPRNDVDANSDKQEDTRAGPRDHDGTGTRMSASIGGLGARIFAGVAAHPGRSALIAGGVLATVGVLAACAAPQGEHTNAAGQQVMDGEPDVHTEVLKQQRGVGGVYPGDTVDTIARGVMNEWDTKGNDGGPDGFVDLRTETFRGDRTTSLPFFQHVDKEFGNSDAKVGYDELHKLLDSVDTDVKHIVHEPNAKTGMPHDGVLFEREIARLRDGDHHWYEERLSWDHRPEGYDAGKLVLPAYGDVSGR